MAHRHDFKQFPELSNSQMAEFYFESPHRQITEDFIAKVIKVHDGDTIRVEWDERDFDFPIRLSDLAAPELDEKGGIASQKWLSNQILGKDVEILLHPSRVEKWGRLLADVFFRGARMSEESVRNFHGVAWADREQAGTIPSFKAELKEIKI